MVAALALVVLFLVSGASSHAGARQTSAQNELDQRVEAFLDANRRSWRDANVPAVDGQKLFDLIVENGYTRAVEVGTSTGHSGIWIAWALSKTGGKLITIEIDEGRYSTAVANFEEAGLMPWIDARLADAHELVPELEGPFDFVFVDADKNWYTQYFRSLLPKLEEGGCFTAHNVSDVSSSSSRRRRRGGGMAPDFVRELLATPGLNTEFFSSGGGLSVSFKEGTGR
jgi:predicted O-methyltransferase YrrM